MSEHPPQVAAAALARKAGLDAPIAVEPLIGGRNNRVFRVDFADALSAVLKCYHSDPRDPRDRLKAEWRFVEYVTSLGVRAVPQPLAADAGSRNALYSFEPGGRADAVTEALSRQAGEFIAAINRDPATDSGLDPASEACFSLADHVATIDRRVRRLDLLDADAEELDEVRAFVEGRLAPAWIAVKSRIEQAAARANVRSDERIGRVVVSPSDFGFHNALVDADGRVVFIDFEYAGLDDPAKLICDYFCQPECPVPPVLYDPFILRIADALQLAEIDLWRARALAPAYRIKWVCIMLNEFSSLGAQRRSFASPLEHADRIAHQLRRAESYLNILQF